MKWLNCTVTEGQFTGEYGVQGQLFNSEQFSMFVPESYVQVRETPSQGKRVDGLIKVNVLDEEGGLVLVSLPLPSFENGRTITVNKEQLQA